MTKFNMLSPPKVSQNETIKYHNKKNQRIAFARFAGFVISNKTVLKSTSPLHTVFFTFEGQDISNSPLYSLYPTIPSLPR